MLINSCFSIPENGITPFNMCSVLWEILYVRWRLFSTVGDIVINMGVLNTPTHVLWYFLMIKYVRCTFSQSEIAIEVFSL